MKIHLKEVSSPIVQIQSVLNSVVSPLYRLEDPCITIFIQHCKIDSNIKAKFLLPRSEKKVYKNSIK